jgi:signal transduction histidine kinase/ActR/RegA family two-component response regulator
MDFPSTIINYACGEMLNSRRPVFFRLTREGQILKWGGPLNYYGLPEPRSGEMITDRYFFMEGLLPLNESHLMLPYMQIPPDATVDLHLIRNANEAWVLILDASHMAADIKPFQQRTHELALLHQQKNRQQQLRPNRMQPLHPDSPPEEGSLLKRIVHVLDIAAMKWTGGNTFQLLGDPPDWLCMLLPNLDNSQDVLSPSTAFPFLANFLLDAKHFWEAGSQGRIESGVWSETDSGGREYMLEASALHTGDAKVLVIESERGLARERRAVIQKGRNLALNYYSLDRLEKALEKARDELEDRVKERTAELERANRQLAHELKVRKSIEQERARMNAQLQQAQKMEAIGTLAGGIAHDFNNILSAVIGFTEIVLIDLPDKSAMGRNLAQVLKAGYRARDLVKQILAFSRQTEQEKKPIHVKLITSEALKLLRASLPSTIEIVRELKTDAMVLADPTQIHQIVMNLCTNAGHAMARNGGTLTVTLCDCALDTQQADVIGVTAGEYVCLMIADTGCGMPPEVVNRIFDPFYTTKNKDQGTGMGLSVVHGILVSYGGGIDVYSVPDQGSQFMVYLPVFKTSVSHKSETAPPLLTGNERVLFIDDEPFQVDMVSQILTRLGYQVEAISDSVEGLNLFANRPDAFDLVITDMTMPKLTGTQLANELLKIRPDIPIILCSGFSEAMARESAKIKGIRAYLMKPIVMEQLATTIRQVIDSDRPGLA